MAARSSRLSLVLFPPSSHSSSPPEDIIRLINTPSLKDIILLESPRCLSCLTLCDQIVTATQCKYKVEARWDPNREDESGDVILVPSDEVRDWVKSLNAEYSEAIIPEEESREACLSRIRSILYSSSDFLRIICLPFPVFLLCANEINLQPHEGVKFLVANLEDKGKSKLTDSMEEVMGSLQRAKDEQDGQSSVPIHMVQASLAGSVEDVPAQQPLDPRLILISPESNSDPELRSAILTRLEGMTLTTPHISVVSAFSLDCLSFADQLCLQLKTVKFLVDDGWNGLLGDRPDLSQLPQFSTLQDRAGDAFTAADESQASYISRIRTLVYKKTTGFRVVFTPQSVISVCLQVLGLQQATDDVRFAYIDVDKPEKMLLASDLQGVSRLNLIDPESRGGLEFEERAEEKKEEFRPVEEVKRIDVGVEGSHGNVADTDIPQLPVSEIVTELKSPSSQFSVVSKESPKAQELSPAISEFDILRSTSSEKQLKSAAEPSPQWYSPDYIPEVVAKSETPPSVTGFRPFEKGAVGPPKEMVPDVFPERPPYSIPVIRDVSIRETSPEADFKQPKFDDSPSKFEPHSFPWVDSIPPSSQPPVIPTIPVVAACTPPPLPPQSFHASSSLLQSMKFTKSPAVSQVPTHPPTPPPPPPPFSVPESLQSSLNTHLNHQISTSITTQLSSFHVLKTRTTSEELLRNAEAQLADVQTHFYTTMDRLAEKSKEIMELKGEQSGEIRQLIQEIAGLQARQLEVDRHLLTLTQDILDNTKRLKFTMQNKFEDGRDIKSALEELRRPKEAKKKTVTIQGIEVQINGDLWVTVVYRKHYPMNVKWLTYSAESIIFTDTVQLSKDCRSFNIGHGSYYLQDYIGVMINNEKDQTIGERAWVINPCLPQRFEGTFVARNCREIEEVEKRMEPEGVDLLHQLSIAWENPSPECLSVFISEIENNYRAGKEMLVWRLLGKGYRLRGEFAKENQQ